MEYVRNIEWGRRWQFDRQTNKQILGAIQNRKRHVYRFFGRPQWDKANYSRLRTKVFYEEVENREVLERASQHIVIDRMVRNTVLCSQSDTQPTLICRERPILTPPHLEANFWGKLLGISIGGVLGFCRGL